MKPPSRLLARFAVLGIVTLLPACGRACKKDQPYVPYTVDSAALPGSVAAPPSASAPLDSLQDPTKDGFPVVKAERAPKDATEVTVDGARLGAPSGYRFDLILKSDLDSDGKTDVVAWVRNDESTTGELVQFTRLEAGKKPRSKTLASLPPSISVGQGCHIEGDLAQVGKHTALVSVRVGCRPDMTPTGPTRWTAVVVPMRDPASRLSLTSKEPRDGAKLEISVDALDRDGDDFDDVVATVSLSGKVTAFDDEEPPAVSVGLHYFDRPAGLSRDPHQPTASFQAMAKRLERKARDKDSWPYVSRSARRLRQLHRALCGGGSAPVISVDGATLQCGAGKAMALIDSSELNAAVREGRLLWALSVLRRMQEAGAGYDLKKVDQAREKLVRALGEHQADSYHLPFAPLATKTRTAAWGGLAFDSGGALLIRTASSILRFDPKTRVALPDTDTPKVGGWPSDVISPDGKMGLAMVGDPCDGGLLRVYFAPVDAPGQLNRGLPLPVPSGGCTGKASPMASPIRVVAWDARGLDLVVRGTPVSLSPNLDKSKAGLGDPRTTLGGPRSPDGKLLVLPTELGVVIADADNHARRWRSPQMKDGYAKLTECAVANGASAVACVDGRRTRVFVPGTL